jgi:rubrerythrin
MNDLATKIKKAEKIFQEGGIYICPMCDGECQFCDDDYQCSECELNEGEFFNGQS